VRKAKINVMETQLILFSALLFDVRLEWDSLSRQ
jgi:hypothetical protein